MEKFNELSTQELGDRLEGYLYDLPEYEDKLNFVASIYRMYKMDQDGEFKESPEHGNVIKDFLKSFFVKKDPDGYPDEEATRKAIEDYNRWKLDKLVKYSEGLEGEYLGKETLKAGTVPMDYMDEIAKDVLNDQYTTYMKENLEEQVKGLDDRKQQYYEHLEERKQNVIDLLDINMDYVKEDRDRWERDNNYNFTKDIKSERGLDSPKAIQGAYDAVDRREKAKEEKKASDRAKAESEVTEYDKGIEEANRKFNDILNFEHNTINPISEKAHKMLERLSDLANAKSNNSKEFNKMYNCLKEVCMNDNQTSAELFTKKLIELREAATAYEERIDGSWFRGVLKNGQERRNIAGELVEFAAESTKMVDKAIPGCILPGTNYVDAAGKFWNTCEDLRAEREKAIQEKFIEITAKTMPKVAPETIYSNPKVAPENLHTNAQTGEEVVSFPKVKLDTLHKEEKQAVAEEAPTIIEKRTGSAFTMVRNKMDLATLMNDQKNDQKKEKKTSPRDEALAKREEIMQKRRENEKAGIANDGWGARAK